MRPRKKRDYASSHIVKGSERKVWKETETYDIPYIRLFVSRGRGGRDTKRQKASGKKTCHGFIMHAVAYSKNMDEGPEINN